MDKKQLEQDLPCSIVALQLGQLAQKIESILRYLSRGNETGFWGLNDNTDELLTLFQLEFVYFVPLFSLASPRMTRLQYLNNRLVV